MAPTSPASTRSTADTTTLADIGAELKRMAMRMVTKVDLTHLTNNLHKVIKSEVTSLKAEIKAQEHRIQQVEKRAQTTEDHSAATDTALKRQGTLILAMRRQLEDQDNRSRRNNIRIRGIPESPEGENIEEMLTSLFRIILREDTPALIKYDRAHRALRPRPTEGTPRDVICCLHSFAIKDLIMRKARSRAHWNYRGAEISLYNDLSPMTLEARRALRPVTTILRERNMQYRWGYPFSITVRYNNEWVSARWPEDIPQFLQRLNLPPTPVPNWVFMPLDPRPQPQRQARRRRWNSSGEAPRHRPDLNHPEE
ncbi:Hypothetical predicted protein [Pelobates cultripes]|uniref:L1 transposable element RRM domain-containing protein n=1 Tax=Pelobates cultripes TaxID=61616 RepID=A0AAD1WKW2_PELCU|nr:Hypothetical predicted protein [Pelobates cultripes]